MSRVDRRRTNLVWLVILAVTLGVLGLVYLASPSDWVDHAPAVGGVVIAIVLIGAVVTAVRNRT